MRRSYTVLALLAVILPTPAAGQRVLGVGEDATVVPKGMLRFTVNPIWNRTSRRFANGLGANPKGSVEPFGTDFSLDTLGERQIPLVGSLRTELGTLLGSGGSALPLSFGALNTRVDRSFTITPLTGEFGVTRRLTIGGMLPLVRGRSEVTVSANPTASGTIGLNPGYAVSAARQANGLVVSQLSAAADALAAQLTACAGSSDPTCAAINADRAQAMLLVTSAQSVALGIQNVYGTSTAQPGTRFAPVERGAVQGMVLARLDALSAQFSTFLGPAVGQAGWVLARPVGAAPLAYGDFQKLLVDSAYGIRSDTLQSIETRTYGDIELSAKYLLWDNTGPVGELAQRAELRSGVRGRVAVAAVYRFGTGLWDSADHFVDVPTGDAQDDIEGRVFADILFGRRLWLSLVGRYTYQKADVQTFRVPASAQDPFPQFDRRGSFTRDLGDVMALDIAPKYAVNDAFGFGVHYSYRSKGEDVYASTASSPAGLSAALLNAGTSLTSQQAAFSVTYSSMASYARGRTRLPMEASLLIGRTLSGANTPKYSTTALTVRFWNKLF